MSATKTMASLIEILCIHAYATYFNSIPLNIAHSTFTNGTRNGFYTNFLSK